MFGFSFFTNVAVNTKNVRSGKGVYNILQINSHCCQYRCFYNINSCGLVCAVMSVMCLCFVMEEIFRALWGTFLFITLAKQLLVIANNDGNVEIKQVKGIPLSLFRSLGPSRSKASLISFQILPSRLPKFLTLFRLPTLKNSTSSFSVFLLYFVLGGCKA